MMSLSQQRNTSNLELHISELKLVSHGHQFDRVMVVRKTTSNAFILVAVVLTSRAIVLKL